MNLLKYGLLLIFAFHLMGCASGKLYQGKQFENEFFSIKWNSKKWSLASDRQESSAWVKRGSGGDSKSVWVNVLYRNISADLGFRSQAYLNGKGQIFLPGSSIFFKNNPNYDDVLRIDDSLPEMMTHNHHGRWIFRRKWEELTYVNDMKCLQNVFLQRGPGVIKKYKIYCGYYDKNKGRRILFISLDYNRIAHYEQWPELRLLEEPPSIQPLEDHLKNAVEHLVSTLEIKNFDWERMESEGLLYPNRTFHMLKY